MMRRKSSRNAAKVSEEALATTVKPDTPRKPSRTSRRLRSRTRSKSLEENEAVNTLETIEESKVDESNTLSQDDNNCQAEPEEINVHKDVQQNEIASGENEEIVAEHQAEVNEEESKGKSKELNSSQDEQSQSSNNVEPDTENEHVQGTPQSPPIDNDVKSDIQKEETDNVQQEDVQEKESNFESQYVQHTSMLNNDVNSQTDDKPEERSLTPEIKGRKRITLKRITNDKIEENATVEAVHVDEEQPTERRESTSKKITLKRSLISNQEKEEEPPSLRSSVDTAECGSSRRSSISKEDENRRPSTSTEDKSPKVEVKPRKPVQKIKLIRNFSQEPATVEEGSPQKKQRRTLSGCSDWLEKMSETLYKIDVDSIKIVCPKMQFLKEEDVKLESVPPRERIKSESEMVPKRKMSTEEGEIKDASDDHLSDSSLMTYNRKISIVEAKDEAADTATVKPPPSPARNPASTVLYITNLVRPFTIKQLRELLEKTGTIEEGGFWTDRIKSKCYVRYTTTEDAEATRTALHGEFWPVGNGKKLKVEFSTFEEMDKVMNPPVVVVPDTIPEKENREPEQEAKYKPPDTEKLQKKREVPVREWDVGKEHRRRSRTRTPSRERVRKHSRRSYTPEITKKKPKRSEEEAVPQKLMDDLFLKTKATPSIYWQPLSPDEIAKKVHQRLVRMEEHKRRIEETRERARDNRRPAYRRR